MSIGNTKKCGHMLKQKNMVKSHGSMSQIALKWFEMFFLISILDVLYLTKSELRIAHVSTARLPL